MSNIESQVLAEQNERVAKLLIVDDNEVNRILLQRMFSSEGYETDVAGNGEEALEKLKESSFDLVLMDIMMPVMDGLRTLENIRANEEIASLPVILISAMSGTDDIVRGLQLGANDYITKPVDMNVARARVKTQVALKFLIDERNQTIKRLEDAQEMREKFFRMASHDLKSPLMNMLTAQTLLAREFTEENHPRAHKILDTMRTTIGSMKQVVEDFLDTAAMQSGELDIKLAHVDADRIVLDVVSGNSAAAIEKDIKLDVDSIKGKIVCDSARLSQVLGNLVSNAVKYSPKGSTVKIFAELLDDFLQINVKDQGPGIADDEKMYLFQPFGKLSNKPTGNESSHGLGLWSAKHLVELQNGEIGIDAPEDGGSCFWIKVPLAKGDVKKSTGEAAAVAASVVAEAQQTAESLDTAASTDTPVGNVVDIALSGTSTPSTSNEPSGETGKHSVGTSAENKQEGKP